MNLGGFWNTRARNRWYRLLADLKNYDSDQPGLNGNDAIVGALIKNLASPRPLPIYFKAHDSKLAKDRKVFVGSERGALFYIDREYLTISLPMRPRPAPKAAPRRKAPARK